MEAGLPQRGAQLLGERVLFVAGDGRGETVRAGLVVGVAQQALQFLGAHRAPSRVGASSGTGR